MKSNMKDCSPVRCHVVYRGASITSIDRSWLIKKKKFKSLEDERRILSLIPAGRLADVK